MRQILRRSPLRFSALGAGIVAACLALTSCSSPPIPTTPTGEEDIGAVIDSIMEGLPDDFDGTDFDGGDFDSGAEGSDFSDGDDGSGSVDPSGPTHTDPPDMAFHLPAESPIPDGWQRSMVDCLDDEMFSAYVSYAVPGDWERVGMSGGSGGPDSMGYDLRYQTPAGLVIIGVESDSVDTDGNILKMGEIVDDLSFDYSVEYYGSSGERTVDVAFDSLGMVDISGQQAELFLADPAQAPDDLSSLDYRIRIKHFDVPQPLWDGDWATFANSFVVQIDDDPSDGTIDTDTLKQVLSTMAMPECAVNHFVVTWESMNNVDIDKDGYINTFDDYAEMLGVG